MSRVEHIGVKSVRDDPTLNLLALANDEIRYAIKRLDERGMATDSLRWISERVHLHLLERLGK